MTHPGSLLPHVNHRRGLSVVRAARSANWPVRPAISLTGPFRVRRARLLGRVLSGARELPGSTPINITYREARKS